MSHFITNFADVVRIPEPQIRNHELNMVVTSCKRFMETVCQNRNIQIIMELDEVSPVVWLDSSLFEQVLVNIIKNAAESIERDGKIYIRTSRNPVCDLYTRSTAETELLFFPAYLYGRFDKVPYIV